MPIKALIDEKMDKETDQMKTEKVDSLKEVGNDRKCAPEIDEVSVGICGKDKSFDELEETFDKTNVEKRPRIDEEGENGLKENGMDKKCALVIDEVSVDIFGNDSGKDKSFDELKEKIDKTNVEKRPRRRGNSRKKPEVDNSCNGSGICVVTESQNVEKKYGDGSRRTYSREEMEALRFVDVEAQKNNWVEVYCRLGSDIVKEYDALANCTQKRQNQLDFDPRKQFQNMERRHDGLGEEGVHVTDNETENVSPSNPISECGEEDDSDDDCNSILRPAFFVSGEPKFDSGPPQDGFEYLRRVRWEAERIPKVKVAKLEKSKLNKEQTVYMPTIPDIEKCPEYLLPTKEWEVTFLADFSELRLVFSRVDSSSTSSSAIVKLPSQVDEEESNTQLPQNLVEKLNNISSEEVLSFADPALSEDVDENADCKTCVNGISKEFPTLSMILKMESVARVLMLRRRISSVANMTSLSKSDCVWLFSLCVAIDTPLDGDTCASLRCLLRKVSSLRAGKSKMDDECIMLNIIATIAGKYFGQSG